ncbi:unnamed protein product [Sympodiomycopsis kandeliae]
MTQSQQQHPVGQHPIAHPIAHPEAPSALMTTHPDAIDSATQDAQQQAEKHHQHQQQHPLQEDHSQQHPLQEDGSQQDQLQEYQDPTWLKPHRSRLPTFFYLLSFAPPFRPALSSPRAFFTHPYVLYGCGTIGAMCAGCAMPALDILYGYWTTGITSSTASPNSILSRSKETAGIMALVGITSLVFNWVFLVCYSAAAHILTVRLRHVYVASVLVQDQVFFDVVGPGEIASRAGKDITTIRVGLGEKISYFIWSLSTLTAGVISAFCHAPKLAGFLFALVPFAVIIFAILGWATEVVGAPALTVEGKAASLTEQILSSVRIVQAFGMAPHVIQRLNKGMLAKLERLGMGRSLIRGLEQSSIWFILNTTYAICFWYGGIQVTKGVSNGNVMTAFWNMLNSLFALANAVPHLSGIFDSYTALGLLRRQIERQPQIDVRNQDGHRQLPQQSHQVPTFELQHVTFAYPSRPHTKSLNDVSVTIPNGLVTAFVGPSGSGKSTIASLFLREYDPETSNIRNPADPLPDAEQKEKDNQKKQQKQQQKKISTDDLEKLPEHKPRQKVHGGGSVLYAGQDIKSYNLRWLRSQISVVSQHPQLFTASIMENVAAGLTGTQWAFRPDLDLAPNADAATKHKVQVIREKCQEALQKADAWTFVSKLPQGMDTVVSGGRAGLLSGGQRQRIAIARALVRQPQVLILDEGTSALDSATEDRIKVMLEKEQRERGMTLILIAHRLSTIAQADKIVVLGSGKILDEGTYEQLISPNRNEGTFREMALAQQAAVASDDKYDDDERLDKFGAHSALPRGSSQSPSGRPLQRTSTTTTSIAQGTTLAPASEISENQEPDPPLSSSRRPNPVPMQDVSNKGIRPSFSGRGGLGHTDYTTTVSEQQNDTLSLIASRSSAVQQQQGAAHHDQKEVSNDIKASSSKGSSDGDAHDSAPDSPLTPHPDRSKGPVVMRKLFKVLGAQKWFYLLGVFGAIAGGASFPIAGWMTGDAVEALSIDYDNNLLRSRTTFWARWFFILACADLIIFLVNAFFLELASEATVRKLKLDAMRALLKQEVGFFDHEDSASGALTSAVTSHPANLGAATGLILSQVILVSTNLLGSIILGFSISWKACVVCLAPVFVLAVSGYLQVLMLEKYEAAATKPAAKAAAYINEAMDTVKTVSALGREAETMRTFDSEARTDTRRSRYLLVGGTGFAISQGMIIFLSALVFYWGGKLLSDGDIDVSTLYSVFEAVIIGAFSAGRLFTYVGDFTRAYSSFSILESWLGRKPQVASITPEQQQQQEAVGGTSSSSSSKEESSLSHPAEGDIVFKDVEMRYPQRPKHPALNCVNLHIKAGSKVAFCGTSGSGKSSILALLERFYDPSKGSITFGGVDSRAMSVEELRKGMAYVSQDPVLFEGTLRWNLTLGSSNPEAVSDAEIESACQQASILDFIRGLENGFDTDIGMKGAQLSGGQKQRLCIARAVLRNAPILLLDEATSALDPTSEKSVQRALDQASIGRTTISIAHRLSTIKNADVIHVVEDGNIVESGSHTELLARKKRYFDLVAAQI